MSERWVEPLMWTCYQTALHAHLQYCSCPLSAVDNILELDFQTNGSVRPQLEWASKHTNLIDKLEMAFKHLIRAQENTTVQFLYGGGDVAQCFQSCADVHNHLQALEFLRKEEEVLHQIALAETKLRLLNEGAEFCASPADRYVV
jgi:hypothetical protein